jgi:lysophospholipase L1-like esterase
LGRTLAFCPMIACRQVVVAAAALLALAGCSSASDDAPSASGTPRSSGSVAPTTTASAPTPGTPYVALGDSFTAGPGIDPQQPDAGFCQRSERNWPTLLAERLDVAVSDVSCAGATTADLVSTLASGVLDGGPRVVTISSGGNDGGLFSALLRACAGGSGTCADYVDGQVPDTLARTADDLAGLLEQVTAAAPDAQVILVGYPRIAPESGTCATIGIRDTAPVLEAETALDAALAKAAGSADVPYVSLRAGSLGHDACAGAEAWTNGISAPTGDGIVFHPNARGMAAVADIVAQTVDAG